MAQCHRYTPPRFKDSTALTLDDRSRIQLYRSQLTVLDGRHRAYDTCGNFAQNDTYDHFAQNVSLLRRTNYLLVLLAPAKIACW